MKAAVLQERLGSHTRPEPIAPICVPDSRDRIVASEIIAEDHELKRHGGAGYREGGAPELETGTKSLERCRYDVRRDPEIRRDDQSGNVRRPIVEDLEIDGQGDDAGLDRIGQEGHIGDRESCLHPALHSG